MKTCWVHVHGCFWQRHKGAEPLPPPTLKLPWIQWCHIHMLLWCHQRAKIPQWPSVNLYSVYIIPFSAISALLDILFCLFFLSLFCFRFIFFFLFSFGGFYWAVLKFKNSFLNHSQSNKLIKDILYFCYSVFWSLTFLSVSFLEFPSFCLPYPSVLARSLLYLIESLPYSS